MYRILTKDFGLIGASAQGVRLLKSKLRYALQPYAYCRFAFVRGKDMWRITGVEELDNVYRALRDSSEKLAPALRVFALLKRLLHGEEGNAYLYTSVEEAFHYLKNAKEDEARDVECILVMRILYALGYMGSHSELKPFVVSPYLTDGLVLQIAPVRKKILTEINRSLHESQL
jgi:DNA repair protein RecO